MGAAPCRRRGFTLIELLVVVTVVAILAGLVLPALAGAKAAAKRIQCTNNHKQLATTWLLYTADNADGLVPNGQNDQPSTNRCLWVQGAFYHLEANTNYTYILDPRYALFANYLHTLKVYVCPTDRSTVTVARRDYPRLRSYALNAYAGWIGPLDARLSSAFRIFRRHSEVGAQMPAGLFLFQDVHPNSICWPYFGVHMERDSFFNFPNSSHSRGTVISFGDGHAEHHRWRDPRTIAAFSADYHRHDDPSPGNADLAWIRARTTMAK